MDALIAFVSAMPRTVKYWNLLKYLGTYDVSEIFQTCPPMSMFSPQDIVLGYAVETVAFVYMTYVANAPKKLAERGLILAVDINIAKWSVTGVIIPVPPKTPCEKRRGWILRMGSPRKSVFMPQTPREYFGAITWNFLRYKHRVSVQPCTVQYDDANFDEDKLAIWADECMGCRQPMEWRSGKDLCASCVFENTFDRICQDPPKKEKAGAIAAIAASAPVEIVEESNDFELAFPQSELELLGFVF